MKTSLSPTGLVLLAVSLVLAAVAFARGEDLPAPKFKTFPIPVAGCNCEVTGICTCGSSCDCPLCFDYSAARARAVATGQPLVCWVGGYLCPPCMKDLKAAYPDAVHYFKTDSWGGDFIPCGVIVSKTDAAGNLVRLGQLPPGSTGEEIVRTIKGVPVVKAVPFGPGSATTPATTARTVVIPSTPYPGTTQMAPTFIPAPIAGFRGGTNCVT